LENRLSLCRDRRRRPGHLGQCVPSRSPAPL